MISEIWTNVDLAKIFIIVFFVSTIILMFFTIFLILKIEKQKKEINILKNEVLGQAENKETLYGLNEETMEDEENLEEMDAKKKEKVPEKKEKVPEKVSNTKAINNEENVLHKDNWANLNEKTLLNVLNLDELKELANEESTSYEHTDNKIIIISKLEKIGREKIVNKLNSLEKDFNDIVTKKRILELYTKTKLFQIMKKNNIPFKTNETKKILIEKLKNVNFEDF